MQNEWQWSYDGIKNIKSWDVKEKKDPELQLKNKKVKSTALKYWIPINKK